MKYAQDGIDYRIINGGTKIVGMLPAGTYEVQSHPMMGMWLSERHDLAPSCGKIYGPTDQRIDKTFDAFKTRKRNLGVLLSGSKGMGKSLFMQRLAQRAVEKGMPVIVIQKAFGGLPDFIAKIEQECVVLFDEFEKIFVRNEEDGVDLQTQFLSLLDGTDCGRKIFAVSVNDTEKLSQYFINRPGRFFYHFKFDRVAEKDARAYASDFIGDKSVVDKIANIARLNKINYDVLSAIVSEVKHGYSLKESVADLNVEFEEEYLVYDVFVDVAGTVLRGNLTARSDNDDYCIALFQDVGGRRIHVLNISLDLTKVQYDQKTKGMCVPLDGVNWTLWYAPFGKFTRRTERIDDRVLASVQSVKFEPPSYQTAGSMMDSLVA